MNGYGDLARVDLRIDKDDGRLELWEDGPPVRNLLAIFEKEDRQLVQMFKASPAMLGALKVISLDTKISGWLRQHDPNALRQVRAALTEAEKK